MSILGHVLLAIALIIGLFFNTMGVLGILRFPDVYTRLHADTKATTFGSIFLAIAALLLVARDWIHAPCEWGSWLNLGIHILFALVVLLVTNATGGHAIARAAWRAGHRPDNLAVDRLSNPVLPPPPPPDPAATTMEMAAISVLVAPPAKDAPETESEQPAVPEEPAEESVAAPEPAVEEPAAEPAPLAKPEPTEEPNPPVASEQVSEKSVAEPEPAVEPAPAVEESAAEPGEVPRTAFASIFGVQNILDFQETPDSAPPPPADGQSASLSDSIPPTPTEDA